VKEKDNCAPVDYAIELWKLLISKQEYRYIDEWCEFLKIRNRTVNYSLWCKLFQYLLTIHLGKFKAFCKEKISFSEHVPGKYPAVIDEFVQYMLYKGE
jgi:hypothetical protein